jgi:hypothetical protein
VSGLTLSSVPLVHRTSHPWKSPARTPVGARGLGERQVLAQLSAGADAELGEHLVHSAVRGLMNSCAPISGFVWPSAASRATCVSCTVSVCCGSLVRLRTVSPVAWSSRRALSANPAAPKWPNMLWAVLRCSRASTRRCSRRSHSPYTRWARARCMAIRLRPRRSIASEYRLSAAGPSVSRARDRASMPSAQSDPAASARSLSSPRAVAASSLAPQRAPASMSSARDQPKKPRSSNSQACRAPASAASYPARPLCSTAVA